MNIGFGSLSFSSSFPAGAWALSAARVRKSNARLAKKRFVMESLEENARVVSICA
jgi:hypothetical protein